MRWLRYVQRDLPIIGSGASVAGAWHAPLTQDSQYTAPVHAKTNVTTLLDIGVQYLHVQVFDWQDRFVLCEDNSLLDTAFPTPITHPCARGIPSRDALWSQFLERIVTWLRLHCREPVFIHVDDTHISSATVRNNFWAQTTQMAGDIAYVHEESDRRLPTTDEILDADQPLVFLSPDKNPLSWQFNATNNKPTSVASLSSQCKRPVGQLVYEDTRTIGVYHGSGLYGMLTSNAFYMYCGYVPLFADADAGRVTTIVTWLWTDGRVPELCGETSDVIYKYRLAQRPIVVWAENATQLAAAHFACHNGTAWSLHSGGPAPDARCHARTQMELREIGTLMSRRRVTEVYMQQPRPPRTSHWCDVKHRHYDDWSSDFSRTAWTDWADAVPVSAPIVTVPSPTHCPPCSGSSSTTTPTPVPSVSPAVSPQAAPPPTPSMSSKAEMTMIIVVAVMTVFGVAFSIIVCRRRRQGATFSPIKQDDAEMHTLQSTRLDDD